MDESTESKTVFPAKNFKNIRLICMVEADNYIVTWEIKLFYHGAIDQN